MAKMAPMLGGQERFRPPRIRDIAGVRGAREGEVRTPFEAPWPDGKGRRNRARPFLAAQHRCGNGRDHRRSRRKLEDCEFSAAQLRDRLDNGRKVAIQILEFFDRHGVTLRRGDVRRINKHRHRPVSPSCKVRRFAEKAVSGGESSPVGRPDFKSGRGREPVLWWVRLPSLFRHVQRECNETRAILSPCQAGHRNAKDLQEVSGREKAASPGVAPTEAAHVR